MSIKEVITLEELQKELEFTSKETFTVTEDFPNSPRDKKRSLTVDSLMLELEDEYVVFSDPQELLLENMFVLMMFLKKSVNNIIKISNCDSITYQINFADGTITIE